MEHICFYFVTGGPKMCFYWGVPNVPKKLVMGQSICHLLKLFKKKCECTHGLINMNHNRCSQVKVKKAEISDRLKLTGNINSAQPMRNCSMDPID